MANRRQEIDYLADTITTEIDRVSDAIAKRMVHLLSEGGDVERMTRAQYLDMIRRHWWDRNFRMAHLQRVGPSTFIRDAKEALENGIPGPSLQAQAAGTEAPAIGGMPMGAVPGVPAGMPGQGVV